MTTNNKNRKGGYVNYYQQTSSENDYMLDPALVLKNPDVYVPPNSDTTADDLDSSSLYSLPNMSGGNGYRKARDCGMRNCDAFEFSGGNSFLYSLKGGCACNSSSISGGNGDESSSHITRKGGAFSLAPYVTAISLLAARILADKKLGFFGNENEVVGGSDKKRREYRRK